MISYRIETFDKSTGAYQWVEVVNSREEMITYCTAPWRRASTHVIYLITPHHLRAPIHAVFIEGRCVSPMFNDLYR